MPICRLMMNSSRARPTPAFGSRENANAWSGVPTFIMIFTGMAGIVAQLGDSTVNPDAADEPGVALGAGDGHRPAGKAPESHRRCPRPLGYRAHGR